ncbi:XrtA-associated ATPase [Sphingobium sp. DEHP117]|uniref:XrtA/PEP-CTERM system-associated ATPase n=1 Tax=Sphingobium sp. DEHP117 TaxID=2993436 RepID=UPI0027D4D1BE|nr:XrtA/PEP-CTERM system-associated ATPase [Sphingobium sp. DEHP117]MDQ4419646.1 XrtA-associated ATPase [Sphingobium sp. DEHP117]
MYDQFYALKGRPFQLTPDPHFYFESGTHRKALSYLGYGLAQGEGFIVITGEIGAGKTTLVGHVMSTIDPQRLTAVKIVSTQVEGDDLLRLVAQQFGITEDHLPKAQLLQRIEAFLHAQARKGLRTLLIVDEAQGLSVSAIEELRMLSNFQLGGQALLQIFLLGQPEFRTLMNAPELEQLRQRVIATHHLEPMLANEVEPYIRHRLSLVGWTNNPHFTADAYAAIYAATDGVPRRINALMSRVMLLGAVDHLSEIDAHAVEAVAADMGLVESAVDTTPASAPAPIVAEVVEPTEEAAAPDIQPVDLAEVVEEPAPVVDLVDTADAVPLELHRIREELDELRRVINLSGDRAPEQRALAERLDAIEARVHGLESRGDEQEAALRKVLNLLVDWVENENPESRAA